MTTIQEADIRFMRDRTFIFFKNKKSCPSNLKAKYLPHYNIWKEAIDILRKKGFRIYMDRKFAKEYSCLVDSHSWGIKDRLRFQTEIFPAGFKIQFYQNENKKNPHGGFYDFERYKKMPKRHKIVFNMVSKHLIKELCRKYNLDFYDQSEITFPRMTAEEQIIKHCRECSFTKYKIKRIDEMEKFMEDYDFKHNSISKNGEMLRCGEVRYFKDWKGKIRKGRIYHHINNMWWIITSKYKLRNIPASNILGLV